MLKSGKEVMKFTLDIVTRVLLNGSYLYPTKTQTYLWIYHLVKYVMACFVIYVTKTAGWATNYGHSRMCCISIQMLKTARP